MLVKELNKYDLQNEFKRYNRDYFSIESYQAILEDFEDFDDNIELDVISLCCTFSEYTYTELHETYDVDTIADMKENVLITCVVDNKDKLGMLYYKLYNTKDKAEQLALVDEINKTNCLFLVRDG